MVRGCSSSWRADGGWSPRPSAGRIWRVRLLGALVAASGLAGCASISEKIAGTMSDMPVVGLPADAPRRPVEPAAYPAVHDMPPPRMNTVLTDIEQQKLEDDLVAARNAQRSSVGLTPIAAEKRGNAERAEKTRKSKKTAKTDASGSPIDPAPGRGAIY